MKKNNDTAGLAGANVSENESAVVDVDAGHNQPGSKAKSRRGGKTKDRLLRAARTVFERDGFFDARIDDIVTESQVARGTFYTYFKSKSEILEVIEADVSRRFADGSRVPLETLLADPASCISQFIQRYLAVYEENARMQEIIVQVSVVDAVVRQRRLQRRREHVHNIAHAIALWQQNGLADPDIDAELTAAALASMLINVAFWWIVGGDTQDKSASVEALFNIWVKSIGLTGENAKLKKDLPIWTTGPVIGVTSAPRETEQKPLAKRGYWK